MCLDWVMLLFVRGMIDNMLLINGTKTLPLNILKSFQWNGFGFQIVFYWLKGENTAMGPWKKLKRPKNWEFQFMPVFMIWFKIFQ